MGRIIKNTKYKKFIQDIKARIQASQIKAAVKVNTELLKLYWNLAHLIVQKQKESTWGKGFIVEISKDLKNEFPNMKGFSPTNLLYMKKWYLFYTKQKASQHFGKIKDISISNSHPKNLPQLVGGLETIITPEPMGEIFQIPWGHNREIITKCQTVNEALFYVNQTIKYNWSRTVMVHHIESDLIQRVGKAVTNFKDKLPEPQSDLARQTLKDPYNFDFLNLRKKHDEKELEEGLVNHITQFLLELGAGFSFIGKQYRLEIGGDEFFIDLLFYHVKLHCYVVLELKSVKFKPEFAGQLNFYITAVDSEIKTKFDNPTIGILICKSKNKTVVEYALNRVESPIGVSEYTITKNLPDELKDTLPTIEEIEAELDGIVE